VGIEECEPKHTFDEELRSLIRKSNEYCFASNISKNLFETKTVCYFYLLTIGQIIIGSLGALQQKDCLVFHIVERSLFEYLLDLMIVSKEDDAQFNKQFAKYHHFSLYLKRDIIDDFKDVIPQAQERYISEIIEMYPKLLENTNDTKSKLIKPDWQKIEKKAFDKVIRKGWTGLSYQEKLFAVLVMYTVNVDRKTGLEKWNTVRKQLESTLGLEWKSLSFNEQADRIVKEIQGEYGMQQLGLESLDANMQLFQKGFKFASEYTHPTPRSIVPRFSPIEDTYELEYSFKEESIQGARQLLYLVYSSAIIAASSFFGNVDGRPLKDWFQKWSACSPSIWKWLFTKTNERDATRPSH